jgi:DNA-binding transcriptional ArsR family regulator
MRLNPSAAAPVFAALGDATRLRLLVRLSAGEPLSVSRLSEGAGVTRQAVSKHLGVLSRARLIRGSRRGREQLWQLEPQRLEAARRALAQIAQEWEARLLRLKDRIESDSQEEGR